METPEQGDHVFGNIIGVMRTGLMAIIGGGQAWGGDAGQPGRFGSKIFNPNTNLIDPDKSSQWLEALNQWRILRDLDLGHGANPPLSTRNPNIPEPDNHSLMFGGYAKIFQWDLCEVGHKKGVEFSFGSLTEELGMAWVRQVLASYDTLMDFLVDQTALTQYLTGVHQRTTNSRTLAPHTVIARTEALRQAQQARGDSAAKNNSKNKIISICNNFITARTTLSDMLTLMHSINIFWNSGSDRWESLCL